MNDTPAKRIRRSPADARAHILACAEKILIEQGTASVQVRAVARQAGMTDAGITHHFGNLDGLLEALMDQGAMKVRQAIGQVVGDWVNRGPDIAALVTMIDGLYRRGYAELALHVHQTGWKDRGPVLLEPLVAPLMSINKNPETRERDVRAALAAMHLWLALDPLFGDGFRRSVGLRKRVDRKIQMDWWVAALTRTLGI